MKTARTKLKELVQTTSRYTTHTGKTVANEVKGRYQQVLDIVKQRNNMIILRMEVDGDMLYKLSAASASAWTDKQLRSVGFHWKRNKEYWWYSGSRKVLIRKIKKTLKVEPTIQRLT
jgi:hypothetical protein